ncbi:MAG: S8 family serine peptidase [Bacteroidota bacterium]
MRKEQLDVVIPPYLAMPLTLPQAGQVQDWGHKYLQATDFYGKTKGEKAIIFILDTAGRFDHPDLADRTLQEYARNFTNSQTDADEHGHGTHCAGIAAASDNDQGVIGIAPEALLVPVKVLNPNGGAYSWITQGIRYCADVEMPGYEDYARVISMSLGGPSANQQLEDAIDYAIEKGCYVTAAAGNSGYNGSNTIGYPGRYEQVITVASIGKSEMPSRFSSGGDQVDVAAPGEGILSTHLDGQYAYLSGTSMATPGVAGIIALIASYYGDKIADQEEMEDFLEDYAKDIHTEGEDAQTGAGAPLITGYLDRVPDGDDPDEEDPTDPDPPQRPERLFHLTFNDLPILWRRQGERRFQTCTLTELRIAVKTTLTAESTAATWRTLIGDFFRNRGYQLFPDSDFADAAFWAGYFLNLIVGKLHPLQVRELRFTNGQDALITVDPVYWRPELASLNVETFYLTPNTPIMENQIGITQTEEAFDALLALKEAIELSKRDNDKIDFPGDLVNFVAPIPRIIKGVEGANQIPAEWTDLVPTEIDRLRDRFGDIVDDPRWQRAFFGLVTAGDAILEIIQDGKEDEAVA